MKVVRPVGWPGYAAIVCLVFVGCRQQTSPSTVGGSHDAAEAVRLPEATPSRPFATEASPRYSPDRQCAECHAEIADTFQHVGMGRSFSDFDAQQAIETFDGDGARFYHEPSKMYFQMGVRNEAMYVTRYRTRPDGTRINVRKQRVDFVIGSGNHVRGYLYGNELGELFEIPVCWYTQEARWGMAPGYDVADHEDFDRPITRHCMACHNAYPEYEPGEDSFSHPQRFPSAMPQGIGCQRCHGPGSEHVRLASDQATADDLDAIRHAIVNPARLPESLQDDVCLQCHLQPISRRTSIVRRFGRGDYQFLPGERLDEQYVYFELAAPHNNTTRFDINHHPYRLHQSACYRQSQGQIQCRTCHDPHARVPETERAAHYRTQCLTCHDRDDCLDQVQGRSLDADCVACHMPIRRTEDVIHVTMTDHRIGRPQASVDWKAPLQETEMASEWPLSPYLVRANQLDSDKHSRLDPLSIRSHQIAAQLRDHDESVLTDADEFIRKGLFEQHNCPAELAAELGQTYLATGQFDAAIETLRFALSQTGNAPLIQTNLGIALTAAGKYAEALERLEAALNMKPVLPETHYNMGVTLSRLGQREAAEHHYRLAVKLRPTYANGHLNLGNLLAASGRLDEASDHFGAALSLKPKLGGAYQSLASVYRVRGDWKQALITLQDAHRSVPEDSGVLRDLSLIFLAADEHQVRDSAAAVEIAQQLAQREQDGNGEAWLILAFAFAVNQQPEQSLEALEQALVGDAQRSACALVAAMAQHQLGEAEAARTNYAAGKQGLENAQRGRLIDVILEHARERLDENGE